MKSGCRSCALAAASSSALGINRRKITHTSTSRWAMPVRSSAPIALRYSASIRAWAHTNLIRQIVLTVIGTELKAATLHPSSCRPQPTSARRHRPAVSGRFMMATNDPNSAGCKRHDGQTSDSGCARPSHRSRRGSPVGCNAQHGLGFYIGLAVRQEGKGTRAIRINAELLSERTSLGQLDRNEAKIAAAITFAHEAAAARAQDAYAIEQDQAVRRVDAARTF